MELRLIESEKVITLPDGYRLRVITRYEEVGKDTKNPYTVAMCYCSEVARLSELARR